MKVFSRLLMLSLFLGLFTRVFFPHYFPLNFDELIQYDVLTIVDAGGVFDYLKTHERQGPLAYFLFLPLVKAFPQNIFILRFIGIILSLLTVFFFYKLASLFFDKRDPSQRVSLIFSCALFSLSYFPLVNTYTIRPYGVLTLLTVTTTYFFTKIFYRQEDDFPWKMVIGLGFSLLFLAISHPFGLLQAALYIAIAVVILIRKFNVSQRVPFLFFGGLGLGTLVLLLACAYVVTYEPLGFHPRHWPPTMEKVLASFVWQMGGHFNFIGFLGLAYVFHIKRKNIQGVLPLFIDLLLLVFPHFFAYGVSRFIYPIFELRFFGHLGLYSCLLIPFYVERLWGEKASLRTSVSSLFLIGTFTFTFYQQGLLQKGSSLNFREVFESVPTLKDRVTLSCGNCPSFYFDEDKLQCKRGWDFSLETHKNPGKEPQAFILFKKNEWFCAKQVPHGWQEYDFPEVKVFLRL